MSEEKKKKKRKKKSKNPPEPPCEDEFVDEFEKMDEIEARSNKFD